MFETTVYSIFVLILSFSLFKNRVNFSQPFYASPIVITSASHRMDPENINTVYPKHNGITEWLEVSSIL